MKGRICLTALALLGLSFTGLAQTTNNWTSLVSGNWHDLSWSLGIRPQINHSAHITNSGSKAVMLNSTTRDTYPSTMAVNNLILFAPTFATNTLLLNYFGTAIPLSVGDSVFVGTNGVLLSLYSSLTVGSSIGFLRIHGGSLHQEGGSNAVNGLCQVGYDYSSGTYRLTNGFFAADSIQVFSSGYALFQQSGGQTVAREISLGLWGRPGDWIVNNGSVRADHIIMRNGTFEQVNSDVVCHDTLSLATDFGDSSARYSIGAGGSLTAKTISVAGYIDSYEFSPSSFTVNGGSVYAGELRRGDVGSISQAGGTMSIAGEVLGGVDLNGGLLMSSNTIVYNPSSFVLSAIYEQTGGTNITTNRFRIISDALYSLEAGHLDVGDLELHRGGYLRHTGGTLTNRGQVIFSGGSISFKPGHQSLGPIKLGEAGWPSTHSGLSFPAESCTVQFKNSSTVDWGSTDILRIHSWNGSTNGGGTHRILVGVNGLTTAQLEQIVFENPAGLPSGAYNGKILNSGELVPTTAIRLAHRRSPGGLTLLWAGSPTLLSATNVAGPYLAVTNAYSPHEVSWSNGPVRFFRLAGQP